MLLLHSSISLACVILEMLFIYFPVISKKEKKSSFPSAGFHGVYRLMANQHFLSTVSPRDLCRLDQIVMDG